MKENVDKHLENLTEKVMKTTGLESTSYDFKSLVMAEIESMNISSSTTYVPLISKRTWIFILIAVLTIVLFFVLSDVTITTGWLNKIGIEQFNGFEIPNPLANLNVPSTLLYAVGLFGLMLTIQVPLLKRYFDQRLTI